MAPQPLIDVVEPSDYDLNDATESVRNYIAALEEAVTFARMELTLAAAYANMLPAPTTNRAAIIARVGHALDNLGGPIEGKQDNAA